MTRLDPVIVLNQIVVWPDTEPSGVAAMRRAPRSIPTTWSCSIQSLDAAFARLGTGGTSS